MAETSLWCVLLNRQGQPEHELKAAANLTASSVLYQSP